MDGKPPLCKLYSIENKQCSLNYAPHSLVNPSDIILRCNGYKTNIECCWYKPSWR